MATEEPPPPLQIHTFTFGEHSLSVECRKTLDQTLNFKLTVQCEVADIWESLRDFGGCCPNSSDDEIDVDGDGDDDQPDPVKPDLLGLDIWPAALELCTYLAANPSLVSGANVVELGAGVGLPGLLAAHLGARRVLLTDYEPQVVAHVAQNATLCGVLDGCSGLCLDWTKLSLLPAVHAASFDVILAADVLYIQDIMPAFVDTVRMLLSPEKGVALIGHQMRRALVLDETGTPEMIDVDVSFNTFKQLCEQAGLEMRELGRRVSPGFPGPLIMFALARNRERMESLPLAFVL